MLKQKGFGDKKKTAKPYLQTELNHDKWLKNEIGS